MSKYNETLQKRLTEHMKEKGLSQARIAPMVGISPTALSQWRNGKYEGSVAPRKGCVS